MPPSPVLEYALTTPEALKSSPAGMGFTCPSPPSSHRACLSAQSSIALRNATLGTCVAGRRSGWPVAGQVALPPASHRAMKARSYDWPVDSDTGSRMILREMGQKKEAGAPAAAAAASRSRFGLRGCCWEEVEGSSAAEAFLLLLPPLSSLPPVGAVLDICSSHLPARAVSPRAFRSRSR